MNIEVIPTIDEIKSEDIFQKTVIILDVFYTSSTIITALGNGCQFVIPAETIGQAKALKNQNPSYLLAGERYFKRVPGFDLSNSPKEILSSTIDGSRIILTSDGIWGIQKVIKAEQILLGSFLNGDYCVEKALSFKKDIVLLMVGEKNDFALEDGLAAGFLIDLIKKHYHNNLNINDYGISMYGMYKYYEESLIDVIKNSVAGKKLISQGLGDDIEYSCKKNSYKICPYVTTDNIILELK